MNGIETQVTQAVTGLLALAIASAIAYLTPKAKKWIGAHTSAKTAATANDAISGLSAIAQSVVADFNQRIVADAKANGVWNAQLAQQIKRDAVQSVLSQAGSLTQLASSTVGNVQDLVASLVESAVAGSKGLTTSTTTNVHVTSGNPQDIAKAVTRAITSSPIGDGQPATSAVS